MEKFHCFGTGGEKSPALFCPWANTCSIVLCYFGQQPEKRISTHSSRPYTRNSFHENTSVYAWICVENPVIIKLSSQVLFFCFSFSCGTVRGKKASHNMADRKTFVWKCSGNLFSYIMLIATLCWQITKLRFIPRSRLKSGCWYF